VLHRAGQTQGLSGLAAYLIAVAAIAGAVLARLLLERWFPDPTVHATFLLAVAATSWWAGFRPGLLAAVLGPLVYSYLFVGRPFALELVDPRSLLQLALSTGAGAALAYASARVRALERESARGAREARAAAERLRATFETAAVGMAHVAPDGRCLQVNQRLCAIVGYTRDELLQRTFSEITHPEDVDADGREARRLLAGEIASYSIEKRFLREDGSVVPGLLTASLVRAADGTPDYVVAVVHDDTGRRRAEDQSRRALELIEAIAQGTGDAIAAEDAEMRYVFFNEAYRREFQALWGRDLRVGDSMVEALAPWPDDMRKARTLWSRALDGDSFTVTAEFGPDAEKQVYDLRFHPIRDAAGRITGAAHIIRNVTERVATQAALRASTERYRLINLATNDVLWDWDLTTDELQWNDAVERAFGHAVSAVPRTVNWWHEHIHPDDRDRIVGTVHHALESGAAMWRGEYRFRRADGSYASVLDRGHVSRDEQGRPLQMIGSMLDLTEQLAAEESLRESEAKLAAVIDRLPVGVGLTTNDGRTLTLNPAALEIHGFASLDEMLQTVEEYRRGFELLDLDGRSLADDEWPMARALRGLPVTDQQVRLLRPDGEERIVAYTAVPVTSGARDTGLLVFLLQDITGSKRAEQALREADRRKDEFIAVLAHELRNPLGAVAMAAAVLRRAGGSGGEASEMATVIERQSAHLARLIDDLLDISRITRGVVAIRPAALDLHAVAALALEGVEAACTAQGLRVTLSPATEPVLVLGDGVRLGQVIGNLLNNACKFTDRGGQVWVTVGQEDGQAVVRVRDTGIGIPGDQLTRIFEMFTRVNRTGDGLGIGLALARSIAGLHGGSIEAQSAGAGLGSEFIVRLPLLSGAAAPIESRPAAALPSPPARAARRRIVAVDDHRDALQAVARMLEMEGHDVHTADDGLRGFDAVERHRPEIALLDIGMPGIDGYELARRIRQQPWGHAMLLVAMTGWGQEKDKQEALDAGFDLHLTKPVDPDVLDALLADLGARG
jgi:PAS domain S-box-containing protein